MSWMEISTLYKNSLAYFDCPSKLKCEERQSKQGCFNDYFEF